LELGFIGLRSDSSLSILRKPYLINYVLIYFDDILITSSHLKGVDDLLLYLQAEFAMKDLGPMHLFLGMEVIPVTGRLDHFGTIALYIGSSSQVQHVGCQTCQLHPCLLHTPHLFFPRIRLMILPLTST
jgi:hypothetical protein